MPKVTLWAGLTCRLYHQTCQIACTQFLCQSHPSAFSTAEHLKDSSTGILSSASTAKYQSMKLHITRTQTHQQPSDSRIMQHIMFSIVTVSPTPTRRRDNVHLHSSNYHSLPAKLARTGACSTLHESYLDCNGWPNTSCKSTRLCDVTMGKERYFKKTSTRFEPKSKPNHKIQ